MPIAGMSVSPGSVGIEELNLKRGDLSGDLIRGGIYQDFASNGIKDLAKNPSLIIKDDRIICLPNLVTPGLETDKIIHNGHTYIEFDKGVVKVNGQLKADIEHIELKISDKLIRAAINITELHHLDGAGIALGRNNQITLTYDHINDSFKINTNLDIKEGSGLRINGEVVIDQTRLGKNIHYSKLKTVGVLKNLEVESDVNFNDDFFYNSDTGFIGLGTLEPAYHIHMVEKRTQFITGRHKEHFSLGTLNGNNWRILSNGHSVVQVEPTGLYINPTGQDTGGSVLRLRHSDDENLVQTLAIDTVPQKDAIIVKDSQGIQLRLRDGNLMAKTSLSVGNKKITWAIDPPRTGRWEQGSVVYNATPQSGQHAGWICIQTGEPGVWRTFGKID
jgi:hypothetical protein